MRRLLVIAFVCFATWVVVGAQGRGGAATPAGPAANARTIAPKDLTGYWVSVVAEHWHLRMLVPPRGEFAMLPLNAEARKIANAWDPAKEPEAEFCKSYGAPAIMRVPSRLYIHWVDDNTLQMDVDSGTQTRVFRFNRGAGPNEPPQWQGYSVAEWEGIPAQELRTRKAGAPPDPRGGLKVMTTRMRAGYLRKNGVPYSENAVLTEYFVRVTDDDDGTEYLAVTAFLEDPQYLNLPYIRTVQFKKLPNQAGWNPTPCSAR
jgi:hypothetical protein